MQRAKWFELQQAFFIYYYYYMLKRSLVVLFLLFQLLNAQSCLNHNGKAVTWWVQLLYPGSLQDGYAYFDSSFSAPSFVLYSEKPDSQNTPMTRTLNQINLQKLQTFAWNDETPDGKTSGSKAHSKGVLAFINSYKLGFLIDHSIPQFPSFDGAKINTTIDESQSIYGQHVFCLSIDDKTFYSLISKILPIRPQIYAQNFADPNFLTNIFTSQTNQSPDYDSIFTYENLTLGKTNLKLIFKNGAPRANASIFQDGLNNMLKSPIVAETWGRPLQDTWCGSKYGVGNIKTLKFSKNITWSETQDHSKWAYTTQSDYACFGDMNRMTSQWKRGGAFYCLNSKVLKNALRAITLTSTQC